MKKIVLATAVALMFSGFAFAKPAYIKDVGAKGCLDCHAKEGPKNKADEKNPMSVASFDMSAKMKAEKEGKGTDPEYKGKATCKDCHNGVMKYKTAK